MASKATAAKASATANSAIKRVGLADLVNSSKKPRLIDLENEISFFASFLELNDGGLMKPDRGIQTMTEALDHVKAIFEEIGAANEQIRNAVKKAEQVAGIISSCLAGTGFILDRRQVERLAYVKQNMEDLVSYAKTMGKEKLRHAPKATKVSVKVEEGFSNETFTGDKHSQD